MARTQTHANVTKASNKTSGWVMYGPAYPNHFVALRIPEAWEGPIRTHSGSILFIKGNRVVCLSVTPPGYGEDGEGGVGIQTYGPVSEADVEQCRSLSVKPFLAWFETEGYFN